MSEYKNIWVFAELFEGSVKRVSLELMEKAASLAGEKSQTASAVIIGPASEEAAQELVNHGASQVICVKQMASVENCAWIMAQLVDKYYPAAVFFGDTLKGREISAAMSARLGVAMASDCTDVMFSGEGMNLYWIRPVYDGKLYANIETRSLPQLGTFRPGTFKLGALVSGRTGEIVTENIEVPAAVQLTKVLGFLEDAGVAEGNIEDAQIIVSGGKGVGSKEGFDQIYELAGVLGGAVGASRAAVDEGWISRDHQVGATGKTVTPKIYIACGISGAVPHVAGMKDSEIIIAINTDVNAPIFEVANYAIVGDLHKVVPVLTAAIRKIKA